MGHLNLDLRVFALIVTEVFSKYSKNIGTHTESSVLTDVLFALYLSDTVTAIKNSESSPN